MLKDLTLRSRENLLVLVDAIHEQASHSKLPDDVPSAATPCLPSQLVWQVTSEASQPSL